MQQEIDISELNNPANQQDIPQAFRHLNGDKPMYSVSLSHTPPARRSVGGELINGPFAYLNIGDVPPLQSRVGSVGYSLPVQQAGAVKVPSFTARPNMTTDRVGGVNADTSIGAKIMRAFGGTPKTDYIVPPHVASLARSIYVKV